MKEQEIKQKVGSIMQQEFQKTVLEINEYFAFKMSQAANNIVNRCVNDLKEKEGQE